MKITINLPIYKGLNKTIYERFKYIGFFSLTTTTMINKTKIIKYYYDVWINKKETRAMLVENNFWFNYTISGKNIGCYCFDSKEMEPFDLYISIYISTFNKKVNKHQK